MLVKTLDGQEYKWNIKNYGGKHRNRSLLHCNAAVIIKRQYPTVIILEEVPICVARGKTLFLDFYIPLHKIAVEVHGKQHYEYTPYFHNNKFAFLNSLKNDRKKQEWCSLNGIDLVIFSYKDNLDEWQRTIAR